MFDWPIEDRGRVHITCLESAEKLQFIFEQLYNSAATKGQNKAISHEKLTFIVYFSIFLHLHLVI